ncbi:MAG: M20 family metallopeptidase [Anaerolineales bacterium]
MVQPINMLTKAQALTPTLSHLRRTIHMNPELGFTLPKTTTLVSKTLHDLGIEHETGIGKSGIVAHLGNGDGPGSGRVIGIRADMDALPIQEANDVPYKSQIPGRMHACGHDAHTTMLLGVAMLLKEENFNGEIRLLFQPSEEVADEEGLSGAPRMIDDGALRGVDAVIALHVDGSTEVGKIRCDSGIVSANVDTIFAKIIGRGGHGAFPHASRDPIFMTAPILTALHGIVSRWVNPLKPAVVTVGRLAGGSASNIIPQTVEMDITLRSMDDEVRELLVREVENALAISRNLGGDYEIRIERGYPSMINDPKVAGWLEQTADDLLGSGSNLGFDLGMGAEDFAFMTRLAPGAMFSLGTKPANAPPRHLHAPDFDLDENALPIGAAILAETALRFVRGEIANLE